MAIPFAFDEIRPLRRVEYDKLIELGMFQDVGARDGARSE